MVPKSGNHEPVCEHLSFAFIWFIGFLFSFFFFFALFCFKLVLSKQAERKACYSSPSAGIRNISSVI